MFIVTVRYSIVIMVVGISIDVLRHVASFLERTTVINSLEGTYSEVISLYETLEFCLIYWFVVRRQFRQLPSILDALSARLCLARVSWRWLLPFCIQAVDMIFALYEIIGNPPSGTWTFIGNIWYNFKASPYVENLS